MDWHNSLEQFAHAHSPFVSIKPQGIALEIKFKLNKPVEYSCSIKRQFLGHGAVNDVVGRAVIGNDVAHFAGPHIVPVRQRLLGIIRTVCGVP